MKRMAFYLERRSVRRYFVWASREVEAYSRIYPVPASKIEFLPFHHTINDDKPDVRDGGYIFSGGNSDRDYRTLVKAVEGLEIEVRIATSRTDLLEGVEVPDNILVREYSHREYLDVMAGCRINVVSMAAGRLRSAGQQTFLNSMALGKPTIVTDPGGAVDYIHDGRNGILVDPGDPGALRMAILRILGDPGFERKLGANAADAWHQYSTERHFSTMARRIASDLGWSES